MTKREQERREKISKALMGVPKTEEHKKNISKAMRKKVINLDTGEVFDSATLAAESVNRSKGAITHAVKGRSKSCGGYRWAYLTD